MPLTSQERNALLAAAGVGAVGLAYLAARLGQLSRQLARHEEVTLWRSIHETRQLQALAYLDRTLDLTAPLPPLRGWAISPDFAAYYAELLREHSPARVLELGGGASTILSGTVLAQMGDGGQVIALESLESFATAAKQDLQRRQVDNARVLYAPLKRVQVGRGHWDWYDLDALPAGPPFDFLLVDGPAQFGNPSQDVRYPALPLLWDQLAVGALILIDDAARPSERRVVARWQSAFPVDVLAQRDAHDLEKGAVLLRKRAV